MILVFIIPAFVILVFMIPVFMIQSYAFYNIFKGLTISLKILLPNL